MKRVIALLICTAIVLCGCATKNDYLHQRTSSDLNSSAIAPDELAAFRYEASFEALDDPKLLQYVEDTVYASVIEGLSSDDYVVDNVVAAYVSKEYLEEVNYNSQENIYFGYTLSDVEAQFEGTKYVFVLDDAGKTEVRAFEGYDDTYDQALRNVAIGTGVILICVTVSIAAGAVAIPAAGTVSTIFMASAVTGTKFALSSAVLGGIASGIFAGFETRNTEAALKAAALGASEGLKWGAITGVVAGGATKALAIQKASLSSIPSPRQSEIDVLKKYGGSEQISFLGGQEVSSGVLGSTRPDVVRIHRGMLEAIEVKNYDLVAGRPSLENELKRQLAQRTLELPPGSRQRVVLDVRGRGYSKKFLKMVREELETKINSVDPKVLIDFLR